MANVKKFRGRISMITIPTPVQKQIKPHSRFIQSPDVTFTVFYAALLFFILFSLRRRYDPPPHPHLYLLCISAP